MVTGHAAGPRAASNDLDGGVTTMRSRAIALPADAADFGSLSFRYYLAHRPKSTADDYLRVMIEGEDGTRTTVFERLGSSRDVDAVWARASVSLADWAGQTIHLVVVACDGGPGNLLEAAVDNIRIRGT
jgi:aminopeptidase S